MMDWQSIESKMFTAAAYDGQRRVLYLRFTSGDVTATLNCLPGNTGNFSRPSRAVATS